MNAQTTQLKVTLPQRLYDYLESRARRFGLTMSAYIKHLILDDVKDDDMPTYPMSPATETTALKALTEHRRGNTKKLGPIESFLKDL